MREEFQNICPICYLEPVESQINPGGRDIKYYDCPRCGPFLITSEAELPARSNKPDPRVSAWIREHKEFDRPIPEIFSYTLKGLEKNLPNYSASQKQLLLLRAIEHRTEFPGAEVQLHRENDYPLIWASSSDELFYFIKTLEERGLIEWQSEFGGGSGPIVIMVEGWDYLDKHSKSSFTDQAFVAMSFSDELDPIWEEGIKPAIEEAGYKAHRVDKVPHLDRIDAKIIADILDSRFLVADVTEQKKGVYFEAGFALGLKLPVIWCVREDDLENTHFDTRQYNHVVWKQTEDLKEQLYNMICATISKFKA